MGQGQWVRKNKMAKGTFLEANGRGQIWPWPGAQELPAAVWDQGPPDVGVVRWQSLAVGNWVPLPRSPMDV